MSVPLRFTLIPVLDVLRKNKKMDQILEFTKQMIRYAGGIIVAYFVAAIFLIILFGMLVLSDGVLKERELIWKILSGIWLVVIGYAAVSAATYCTNRSSRHISSWFYTAVGAGLFIHHWTFMSSIPRSGDMASPLLILPWLLGGGIIASLYFTFGQHRARWAD